MRTYLAFALLALSCVATPAWAYTSPGAPVGYVNDFANVVSESARAELEASLAQVHASTSNEITVVTVSTLGGDTIEQYAVGLFKEWGIGSKENDNGVLIILAIQEKRLRIEVGYGLEGALPDSVVKTITDEMIIHLRDNDYDGALRSGVERVASLSSGEYVGIPDTDPGSPDTGSVVIVFFFIVTLLQWSIAVLSRSKSYWAGGVLGAVAGLALSSVLGWWVAGGVGLTLALALVGLIFDFAVSSAYHDSVKSGTTPPWWTGGSSTPFSGGGGFGGFGGGRSGGGGASNSW